ncbi:hypothetical protein FB451DRAFT_1374663 [Mycena latifolia]|nr:hypothetical protein FB451DRAFT_1374663 [Mycena latifolia]
MSRPKISSRTPPIISAGQERASAVSGPKSAKPLVSSQGRAGGPSTSAPLTVESNNKGSRSGFYGGQGGHGGASPEKGGAGGDGHASELTMVELSDLLAKFDVHGGTGGNGGRGENEGGRGGAGHAHKFPKAIWSGGDTDGLPLLTVAQFCKDNGDWQRKGF